MVESRVNPFAAHLSAHGHVVLDGGFATALEEAGHVLDSSLWSARVLVDDRSAVRDVHRRYLDAGADCITTSSYQVSFPGMAAAGFSEDDTEALLVSSTDLALEARSEYLAVLEAHEPDARVAASDLAGLEKRRPASMGAASDSLATHDGHRLEPLVAASVGPYGAWLADGSEYDGQYGVSRETLDTFHRRRFAILADSGVDLLACETLPSLLEAEVLLRLLDEHQDSWAWLSFSCRDGGHLSDGSPIGDAVRMCAEHGRVAAVGVNCTRPEHIASLVGETLAATDLPVVVYPNSGEIWDPETRGWTGPAADAAWTEAILGARDRGASILGGCCRIGPETITRLRRALDDGDSPVSVGRA